MPGARLDLAQFQGREPFDAESLACEAAHHRTVHHRAAQRFLVHATGAGQIAHEPAGKTIARARGIVDFLQRKRRHGEQKIAMDEQARHARRA